MYTIEGVDLTNRTESNKKHYEKRTGKKESLIDQQLRSLRVEALRAYRTKEEMNPDIVELVLDQLYK